MNARLFWKSLAVQAAVLAVPFVILALALDRTLQGLGLAVGPAIWLLASLVTARVLSMPLGYVLFSAVAGGVAGAIVFLVASTRPAWWPACWSSRRPAGAMTQTPRTRPSGSGRQEKATQAERKAAARR